MSGERRLRIGVDARPMLEPRGGLRRYFESIMPELYSLSPEHEWLLFVPRPVEMPAALLPAGRLIVVPGAMQAWLRSPWEEWLLTRALNAAKVDVMFSPYGVVPRRSTCPVVGMIHDLYFRIRPDSLGLAHRRYWNSVADRAPRATALLTPSEAVRRDVIALLGVPSERVVVAAHGVSRVFEPVWREKALGPDEARIQGPYVLTFGPWTARKNLHLLVEATRGLVDEAGAPVRLAVVGPPMESSGCAHVVQVGSLTDSALAEMMRRAVATCIPSLHEGFGLPALEAMACGCAVLVSEGGALSEVVGSAGLTLRSDDPHSWRDAIARLLARPEERRRLGLAGIERSGHFSWAKAATVTYEALRQAACAPSRGPGPSQGPLKR